jgi:hypothetical protein
VLGSLVEWELGWGWGWVAVDSFWDVGFVGLCSRVFTNFFFTLVFQILAICWRVGQIVCYCLELWGMEWLYFDLFGLLGKFAGNYRCPATVTARYFYRVFNDISVQYWNFFLV